MSLHGKGITRCVVLAGQMEGSALLYDVKDSLILLGAHQVSPLFCRLWEMVH